MPAYLNIHGVASNNRDISSEDGITGDLVFLSSCGVVAEEGELRRSKDDHIVNDRVSLNYVLNRDDRKKTTYLRLDFITEKVIRVLESRISLVVESSRDSQTAAEGIFGDIYSVSM